jgi:hypothetical protein
VATDDKGAKTTSKTRTIKVTRCDSEASFDFSGVDFATVYTQKGCSPTRQTIPVYASDRDAANAPEKLKVVVSWTAQNGRGAASGSYSGKTTAVWSPRGYFVATISMLGWKEPGSWSIVWSATSTDRFGGKSTSRASKDAFSLNGSCTIF